MSTRDHLVSVLIGRLQNARHGDRSPNIGPVLQTYSTEALQRLQKTIRADHGDNGNVEYTLSTMIDTGVEERWLHEAMTYAPLMDEYPHVIRECISSLQQYEATGLLPDNTDPHGQKLILTLLLTTYRIGDDLFELYDEDFPALNGSYPDKGIIRKTHEDVPSSLGWCRMLTDERLIKFILNHPEKADRINMIVRERGAADYDIIVSVLSSETPALAHGVL